MEPFFTQVTEDMASGVSLQDAGLMVPRLIAAVALGTVLSLRPWRLFTGRALPKVDMVQAQILLCTASAVITAVIGNSMAKAFGLVGLGGFVRFRSGLKDPRDAAILFLVIGLGMACGHGSLGLAGVGTIFVGLLLWVLESFEKKETVEAPRTRMLVSAQADDLVRAEEFLRHALRERNVLVKGCALDFDGRRLELEVEEKEAGTLAAALGGAAGGPLRGLRWMDMPARKGGKEERS